MHAYLYGEYIHGHARVYYGTQAYVCAQTYIHNTHKSLHTDTHMTNICAHIHGLTHTHICSTLNPGMHTYTGLLKLSCRGSHQYIHTCIHTRTHTQTHVCIYIYIYIHTHMF
jgi:hypothetical protein